MIPIDPEPKKVTPEPPSTGTLEEVSKNLDIKRVIRETFRNLTFNGYPIDIDGGNIVVSPAALGQRPEIVYGQEHARSNKPVEFPIVPQIPVPPSTEGNAPRVLQGADVARVTQLNRPYGEEQQVRPLGTPPTRTHHQPHRPRRHTHDEASAFGATLIPVRLKRADGGKTILAYVDAPTSYVVEGGSTGEREVALPSTDSFYDAMGGGLTFAFGLSDASDEDGHKTKVLDGRVNDELPTGMGDDDYVLDTTSAGDIYVGFTYDTDTFEIDSRWLAFDADTPESIFGTAYITIGYVWFIDDTMFVRNVHCGNINVMAMTAFTDGQPMITWIPKFTEPVEWPTE